jgi:hypothetical protein
MGPTIEALSMGMKNVTRNPKLVAISYAVSLASLPLLLVGGVLAVILGLIPIVGQMLARLLVAVPLKVLLLGGMAGAAGKAFAGGASFGDYLESVKDNAVSLAGAFAIYEAIVFAIALAVGVVLLFVVGVGGAMAGGMSSTVSTGFGLGIVLLYVLVFALVVTIAIVFQFLDVAVVLGGKDATGALKESYKLFDEKPISVLGYTVTRALVGIVVVLPGIVIGAVGTQLGDVVGLAGALITLLLFPVAFAAVMSYHAAYYGLRLKAR